MTRPLFEPSTPRQVAGLSWGEDQLYRRPPIPPADAGGDFAWLACNTQPTVGSGGLSIPWDAFWTTNTAVFDMAGGGGTGSSIVVVNQPGVVLAESKVSFFDVGAIVSAVIVGTALTVWDGADAAWFWTGDWIDNTAPTVASQETATKDFSITQTDGQTGTNGTLVRCARYDGSDHQINIAFLHLAFIPCSREPVEVF